MGSQKFFCEEKSVQSLISRRFFQLFFLLQISIGGPCSSPGCVTRLASLKSSHSSWLPLLRLPFSISSCSCSLSFFSCLESQLLKLINQIKWWGTPTHISWLFSELRDVVLVLCSLGPLGCIEANFCPGPGHCSCCANG